MYQSGPFLEFAAKYLKQDIKAESVDEIRELSNLDSMEQKRIQATVEMQVLSTRISSIRDDLNILKHRRRKLEQHHKLLQKPVFDGATVFDDIKHLDNDIININNELALNTEQQKRLMKDLDQLIFQYRELSKKIKMSEFAEGLKHIVNL